MCEAGEGSIGDGRPLLLLDECEGENRDSAANPLSTVGADTETDSE